ncbi:MAG TPA: hypothetical protein VJ989_00965, partial [Solirubrobacterales bacterium]|nr:hypothetical protein [Solirubrobacterales bacterium]
SHTPEAPLADGEYTFRVRATDAASNQAVATRDFEVDTSSPSTPHLSATDPASPANDNNPKVIGTAPVATTVKLYGGGCNGSPLATATAAELEAGIEVTVPDDSTTTFRATASTAAGNTSGCSEPIVYVEDSSAPGTTIDTHPAALSNSADAGFAFSGSDSGSGVASFQCRIDSGSWASCASPKAYAGLSDGAHTFEVRALDRAGNADETPGSFTWAVDTSPAEPSRPSPSQETEPSTDPSEQSTLALKAPPEQAELLRVVRNAKNGTALLIFEVPSPGLLSARPPAITLGRTSKRRQTAAAVRKQRLLKRRIKPRSIRVAHPGRVKVPIVLARAGKRLLAKSHRLRVKVVIRYRAANGTKATWKIAIVLKKRNARLVAESRHRKKRRGRR